MPTEPVAALLYICLLLPGIAFIRTYEGHRPIIKRSAFRETATVIIASTASFVVVFMIHYLLAFFCEPAKYTLRQFFIDPAVLFLQDSQLFMGIVLLDLMVAVLLGAFLGSAAAMRLRREIQNVWRKIRRRDPEVFERGQSAWNAAFERKPDHVVRVGVHLKSGAWLEGSLDTYTDSGDEKAERALTLTGNIWYRARGGKRTHRLEPHGSVIVQASEVDYLTVGYEEPMEY